MKISRVEWLAIVLAVAAAAFAAGWFLRGQASPQPVRVEVERTLVLTDGMVIALDDVMGIDSSLFDRNGSG